MKELSSITLERLIQYYHCINEHFTAEQGTTISSAQLADLLSLDASQIRKDLAAIGLRGHRRVGFNLPLVRRTIERTLGFADTWPAVIVGAGRLGGAIASYKRFATYGLDIVALFDTDPRTVGLTIGDHVVQPLEKLETLIHRLRVPLGILTVPAEATQGLADRLVNAGIKAIWNFAPTSISVPDGVHVRHEELFVGLGHLLHHLKTSGIISR